MRGVIAFSTANNYEVNISEVEEVLLILPISNASPLNKC